MVLRAIRKENCSNHVLLIVDMQNDFVDPNGALYVPHAEQLIPVINRLITQSRQNVQFVFTKDWHTRSNQSFTRNGGIWPGHCVQGSKGAELHPGLYIPKGAHMLLKGTDDEREGLSAFTGHIGTQTLLEFLKENKVETLDVCGVAIEHCVQATVLDARRHAIKTSYLAQASAGIDPEAVRKSEARMSLVAA
ncbi:MAG: isochorismatase family protein [Acidobacteriaceae bacterium]